MDAGGSLVDAQEAASPPSESALPAVLPILPRIARTPRIDVGTILWPLERVARTSRGRSTGRALIASVFGLVLLVFAASNVRGTFDDESTPPAIPHEVTASVHGHRGLAGFRHLDVLPGARAFPPAPALSGPPRSPAGSLIRR
jgi:hypothetical protein